MDAQTLPLIYQEWNTFDPINLKNTITITSNDMKSLSNYDRSGKITYKYCLDVIAMSKIQNII